MSRKYLTLCKFLLQALEDVIWVLRSGLNQPEKLESYYSSAFPTKPLKALQRDGLLINNHILHEDVYEKPMAEVCNVYSICSEILVYFICKFILLKVGSLKY